MADITTGSQSPADARPLPRDVPRTPRRGLRPVDPTAAYAELAKIVLGEQPLGAVMHRIAVLAAQTIPGADDVSVTLIERGRARTVSFSGTLAAALDERQYEDGFGPCMDAAL